MEMLLLPEHAQTLELDIELRHAIRVKAIAAGASGELLNDELNGTDH